MSVKSIAGKTIFSILIIFFAFTLILSFSSCSKKETLKTISITIKNGGSKKNGTPAIDEIKVNVYADNQIISKSLSVKKDEQGEVKAEIKPGFHSIRIEDEITGASAQPLITADKEIFITATFYNESKNIGYFDVTLKRDEKDRPAEETQKPKIFTDDDATDKKLEELQIESKKIREKAKDDHKEKDKKN